MPLALNIDVERLAGVCRRYRVRKLELFGSRAQGSSRPDSDVDLLVTFQAGATPGLEFVMLAEELEALFDRHVDLLVREDAERDENPIRRASIFRTTETIYAA